MDPKSHNSSQFLVDPCLPAQQPEHSIPVNAIDKLKAHPASGIHATMDPTPKGPVDYILVHDDPSCCGKIVPSMQKRILVKRNPALIRSPGNDPRPKRDPAYIRDLAENIQKRGLRNPPYIANRGGYEEIVVGEHRRLALVQLGWTEADFFLLDGELTEADLAIERWQEAQMHTGFSSRERVAIYQTMIAQGLSRAQIADLLNTDDSTISRDFRTKENLAPLLQADLEAAKLGVSVAYILTMLPDQQAQLELAQKYYAGLLTRDALYKRVKAMLGKREKKPAPVKGRTPGGVGYTLPPDDLESAHAEIILLAKAIKKAMDLGLPVASVPSLLKGNMSHEQRQ